MGTMFSGYTNRPDSIGERVSVGFGRVWPLSYGRAVAARANRQGGERPSVSPEPKPGGHEKKLDPTRVETSRRDSSRLDGSISVSRCSAKYEWYAKALNVCGAAFVPEFQPAGADEAFGKLAFFFRAGRLGGE